MTTMEGIIRPFLPPDPGVRATAFNEIGVPTVRLAIGRNGSGVQFGGSYSITISFYQDKAINENKFAPVSPEMQAWAIQAINNAGSLT
jgi:hypothetical protein